MNWLDKLIPPKIKIDGSKKGVPQGIWKKCDTCQETLYKPELERNLYVCTHCGHHSRLAARIRLESFFDHKTFTELGKDIKPVDMLKFKDSKRYKDRISDAQKGTKENDAMIIAYGELKGLPVTVAAFNFEFMGGSMGSVVGEKFLRAVLHSIENKTPFICFSSSGGARMQEGLFSLMQMAKTSAALAELDEHHLPYVSVLTDPTMGGVSASLALLGDIIVAEPNALIGFAGPRVIEQTVREKLPEGFQRAEFLLEHGAIDLIISRLEMRDRLFNVLSMLMASKSVPVSDDDAVADETLEEPTESV